MKKIILLPENIIDNIPTEEELSDGSMIEAIYIRKLKALAESLENGSIDVLDKPNVSSQVYCEKHEIWFQSDEFKLV